MVVRLRRIRLKQTLPGLLLLVRLRPCLQELWKAGHQDAVSQKLLWKAVSNRPTVTDKVVRHETKGQKYGLHLPLLMLFLPLRLIVILLMVRTVIRRQLPGKQIQLAFK